MRAPPSLPRSVHRCAAAAAGATATRDSAPRLVAGLLIACALGPGTAAAQIFAGPPAASGAVAAIVLSNFRSDLTPDLVVDEPAAAVAPGPALRTQPGSEAGAQTSTSAARPPARRLPAAPAGIAELVDAVALQVNLAPALLHAVVAAESAYDVRAVSARGAIGLMQLMPATARRFGARDALAPRDNLLAGAQYLKWLLAQFDGEVELALAAYNAGEHAVLRAGRRIPHYAETQAYVPRVLAYLACAGEATCRAPQNRRITPP